MNRLKHERGTSVMSKRLQIDYVNVKDVKFGEKTSLENGCLTVNKEEIMEIVSSNLFGSCDVQLACPGEDCRILAIHDVMQPRCKADHPEESYPGIWGKLSSGRRRKNGCLEGCSCFRYLLRKM